MVYFNFMFFSQENYSIISMSFHQWNDLPYHESNSKWWMCSFENRMETTAHAFDTIAYRWLETSAAHARQARHSPNSLSRFGRALSIPLSSVLMSHWNPMFYTNDTFLLDSIQRNFLSYAIILTRLTYCRDTYLKKINRKNRTQFMPIRSRKYTVVIKKINKT